MNLPIETLNDWAEHALGFAWPMLWQSSLLIGVLFALDWLLKRKLRPAVRYTLWLAVLIKLLLPPSLAVPTSAAWWLRPAKAAPAVPRPAAVIVTYSTMDRLPAPATALPLVVPAPIPRLTWAAAMFLGAVGVSFGLLSWMLRRWQQVARDARRAAPAPDRLGELLSGRRRPLRLRLTDRPQSPAVCGLFRPVILLPRSLAGQLPPAQLRAVLLHELIHLRRGDVWVNCAQALLQIVYWWHPLLWLANARIRRLREEAVDDAVMVALKDEADTYAPTLLEVAKLALPRPLASLGLVGILESRNSLRQRIERLMDFRPPRRAGLTLTSALGVLSFAALAVPMGEAPAPTAGPGAIATQSEADRRTTETLLAAGSPATNQPLYVRPSSATDAMTSSSPHPASTNAVLLLAQIMKVKTLIQDGKLLYEMGKLNEAEVKLRQAVREDPQNQVASYYLNLVKEARHSPTRIQPKVHPSPGSQAKTNTVHIIGDRSTVLNTLNDIRFDRVAFDGVPLSEVVQFLAEETRKRDPRQFGINFLLNSPESAPGPGQGATNPAAGSPKAGTSSKTLDLAQIPITFKPPVTNVRLADVLDLIVKVAGQPIKYSIEDYAVVFSPQPSQQSPPLYVRTFKIGQNTLIEGLRKTTGSPETNGLGAITSALRDYLLQAGVDLDPMKHPGKALFYKDRQGMLLVRATMEDLDLVERLIDVMCSTPPQIMIQACFIEVSEQEASKAWNSLAAAGTAPNGIKFAVLTTSQAAAVRKQLAPPGKTNVLAAPRVVTLSSRQARALVATVQKIVTGINPRALTPPGITVTNEDESLMLATESLSIGVALDVIPCLMEKDDYTLSITVIPTVTEFLGYADPGTNRVAVYVNGKQKWISEPRPNVRQRQMIATAQVWDGQTLMLGNPKLVTPGALKIAAKPGESSGDGRKRLIVLVTPALVDSAGNRVHTDEEMPFAREGIPAQPAR